MWTRWFVLGVAVLVTVAVSFQRAESQDGYGGPGIEADLPTMQPVPGYGGRQNPGRGRTWPAIRPGETGYEEAMQVAERRLAGLLQGAQAGWQGAPEVVLRLAKGVAVAWMPDGRLYQVEHEPDGWRRHPLAKYPVDRVDVRDLDGDGWPELSASWNTGSGGILILNIFTWDGKKLRLLFHHEGAAEPGRFGFFDLEADGRLEL